MVHGACTVHRQLHQVQMARQCRRVCCHLIATVHIQRRSRVVPHTRVSVHACQHTHTLTSVHAHLPTHDHECPHTPAECPHTPADTCTHSRVSTHACQHTHTLTSVHTHLPSVHTHLPTHAHTHECPHTTAECPHTPAGTHSRVSTHACRHTLTLCTVSSLFSIPHKQPSTNTIHFKAHTPRVCVCVHR